jgi:hypothetical protein
VVNLVVGEQAPTPQQKGNKPVGYSFGELIELVSTAFPEAEQYQDRNKAQAFLAGMFYTLATEDTIKRIGDYLAIEVHEIHTVEPTA